jgi:phosphate transport system substrate-binding protein
MPGRTPGQRRMAVLIAVLAVVTGTQALLAPSAGAAGYIPISGSGSTWSSNALDQWRRNVANLEGITVNYSANGSASPNFRDLGGLIIGPTCG